MEQDRIINLFNEISSYYDKANNIISLGLHKHIKKSAIKLLGIKSSEKILDLCTGTGDFVKIVGDLYPSAQVVGVDRSKKMLKLAENKNMQNTFICADCTQLPFEEKKFDIVTIGFGLRNIIDRNSALFEIKRVLNDGGKFLHIDFGKHNFLNRFFDKIAPFLVEIMGFDKTNYEYLIKSKNNFPEPDALVHEYEKFGFKLLKQKNYLFGAISAQVLVK